MNYIYAYTTFMKPYNEINYLPTSIIESPPSTGWILPISISCKNLYIDRLIIYRDR